VAAAAISQFVRSLAAAAAAAAAVLMLSARRTSACLRCDAAPWRAAALPPRLHDRRTRRLSIVVGRHRPTAAPELHREWLISRATTTKAAVWGWF